MEERNLMRKRISLFFGSSFFVIYTCYGDYSSLRVGA